MQHAWEEHVRIGRRWLCSFSHDQGRIGRDSCEDIHAHALSVYESVAQLLVIRTRAAEPNALAGKGCSVLFFHRRLGRPVNLICRLP